MQPATRTTRATFPWAGKRGRHNWAAGQINALPASTIASACSLPARPAPRASFAAPSTNHNVACPPPDPAARRSSATPPFAMPFAASARAPLGALQAGQRVDWWLVVLLALASGWRASSCHPAHRGLAGACEMYQALFFSPSATPRHPHAAGALTCRSWDARCGSAAAVLHSTLPARRLAARLCSSLTAALRKVLGAHRPSTHTAVSRHPLPPFPCPSALTTRCTPPVLPSRRATTKRCRDWGRSRSTGTRKRRRHMWRRVHSD